MFCSGIHIFPRPEIHTVGLIDRRNDMTSPFVLRRIIRIRKAAGQLCSITTVVCTPPRLRPGPRYNVGVTSGLIICAACGTYGNPLGTHSEPMPVLAQGLSESSISIICAVCGTHRNPLGTHLEPMPVWARGLSESSIFIICAACGTHRNPLRNPSKSKEALSETDVFDSHPALYI